nr:MAG TPA: hypothetical protein [Caudoviricetes sp.]
MYKKSFLFYLLSKITKKRAVSAYFFVQNIELKFVKYAQKICKIIKIFVQKSDIDFLTFVYLA